MGSKSAAPQVQTQTSGPPEWALPYFKDFYARAANVADQPFQNYDKSRVADMNAQQLQGLQMVQDRAMNGSGELNAARGALTGIINNNQMMGAPSNANMFATNQQAGAVNPYATVSNQFAGLNNPYLTNQIDQASQDVTRNYNNVVRPQLDSAMARSGSFGNTGIQQQEAESQRQLAGQLGNIAQGMRYNDYQQQIGLDENRVGRLYNAGQQLQQQQYSAGRDYAQQLFSGGEAQAGRQMQQNENQFSRQLQAIGMAPQFANSDYIDAQALSRVGDTLRAQQQAYLDDDYARFAAAQAYGNQQLATMAGALGVNAGNTTTGTMAGGGGGGGSRGAGALGGALTGAQLGSSFGPWGTGIGAGIGLLGGLL